MFPLFERIFKLSQNHTTVKTEVVAGLTTFMTMAYIIALNPNLLTNFDVGSALWNGVFLATCIASFIGMVCMAFLANKPFAMAPGMGLNSFFAVVVGNIVAITGMSYVASFQAALVIILIEGIVFIALSFFNVREKIVASIPLGIRLGISPAIGLMLMNIGLGSNVGIYAEGNGFAAPFYVMRDFFGALTPSVIKTNMGDAGYTQMVLTTITMFVGLFVIVALDHKKVKGSVLLGMLAASVVYWIGSFTVLGTNPFASLATASFVPRGHGHRHAKARGDQPQKGRGHEEHALAYRENSLCASRVRAADISDSVLSHARERVCERQIPRKSLGAYCRFCVHVRNTFACDSHLFK